MKITNNKVFNRKCEKCQKLRLICGQAFTTYKCKLCRQHYKNSNTCTPNYCDKCSNEFQICKICGEKCE